LENLGTGCCLVFFLALAWKNEDEQEDDDEKMKIGCREQIFWPVDCLAPEKGSCGRVRATLDEIANGLK
jgi:hypothetical protein